MKVRIGTRGSQLALWQANYISKILNDAGIETTIKTIETKGDKILDKPFAQINDKGLFTKELETALLESKIDIAIHSAKDLQSIIPDNLELIAFTQRAKTNDVLISLNRKIDLKQPLRLGTSSARRTAQIKHYYPHISCEPIRGNIPTRIEKLKNGKFDAIILAYAGVERLGYLSLIIHEFPTSSFIPAVGQGSIAVQVSFKLSKDLKNRVKELVNHVPTEQAIRAERIFLKKLGGGCSVPVFALAQVDKQQIRMAGGISNLDGKIYIQINFKAYLDKKSPEQVGSLLYERLVKIGAQDIMNTW